ncbi:SET domain-containing protein-lysine N-methyltransferase [Bradyrhizobium sp. STM 3566]|uniref:SET domain-containing protein-lysine N-methyltransferase n=1 Tax=Bradyrhizobium sp. STM 3566 TaxID=578928 RepID=UPI0038910A39
MPSTSRRETHSMAPDDHASKTSNWLFVGPSEINGFGLFSRKPISCGAVVGRLGGVILAAANKRTIQIGRHRHLCSNVIDFLNHSCHPTAYVRVECEAIILTALAEIGGETDEITVDYNCSEYSLAERFMCRCCRKPNYIAGYRYLTETNQYGYLRSLGPFLLSHLVHTSGVNRMLPNKPC